MKRYKEELTKIQADAQFKQHLKNTLRQYPVQTETRRERKGMLVLASIAVLFFIGIGFYLTTQWNISSDEESPNVSQKLPTLILNRHDMLMGGFGIGGINTSETKDPQVVFAHHSPYPFHDTITHLPVYENRNQITFEQEESTYTVEEGMQVLQSYAKKLGIYDGVIELNYNGLPYLKSSAGTLELNGKDSITLYLSDAYIENHPHHLYDDSQTIVMEHVKALLEEEPLLSFLKNPWIDVQYQGITDDNTTLWQIQVSECGDNELETFVHHQMNAVTLSYNDQGKLWMIRISTYDSEGKIGDYPIKSLKQAEEDLLSGNEIHFQTDGDLRNIVYTDLIYLKMSGAAYHLPYYRFVVKALNQDLMINNEGNCLYVEYYVPAIENRYYTLDTSQ